MPSGQVERNQEERNRKAEAEVKRARKQEARGRKKWGGSGARSSKHGAHYSEEEDEEGENRGQAHWEGRGKQGAQWNSGDRARHQQRTHALDVSIPLPV